MILASEKVHIYRQKGIGYMENRKFGYCRISDASQNELRQIIAMKKFGISERDIYVDKQSGKA